MTDMGKMTPEDVEATRADRERYAAALHGMQSGVLQMMEFNDSTSPKHLRVGANSAMVETGTLARLLVSKGVFTWPEFYNALADTMEEERDGYALALSQRYGVKVTLL